jgi:hypothetical protein
MITRQLFFGAFVLGFAVPCLAQGNASDTDQRFTADVLKTTLFARTAEERRFCDYVIQRRDDGTIPARLIYAVYQKAVTKDRHRRFTYFRTGLEIVCKREGIVLNPTQVQTSTATPSFVPSAFRWLFQRN